MDLFLGFVVSLLALVSLRDILNRYIFKYLMFLIRNEKVAMLIFALLFLPGVVLHEVSHWLMAKLLFVKTHRFSLFPEWLEGGSIRFGFVELSKTDKIRGALIGLAPLLTGIVVTLWIAFSYLHLGLILEGVSQFSLATVWEGVRTYYSRPDVLLWSYLLLAVSNTMLPSTSDRKAWFPAVLAFAIVYITIILVVMGSPASLWLVEIAKELTKTLTRAFGIAVILNLVLLLPLWLLDLGFKQFRR